MVTETPVILPEVVLRGAMMVLSKVVTILVVNRDNMVEGEVGELVNTMSQVYIKVSKVSDVDV